MTGSFSDLQHLGDILKHTSPSAFASHLLHRTAEVQVDQVRTSLFHNLRRFHHRLDISSVDLDTHRALSIADGEFGDRGFHIADQSLGRDKLRIDHRSAETLTQQSETDIRHILHGCQEYGPISKINVSYLHFDGKGNKNP